MLPDLPEQVNAGPRVVRSEASQLSTGLVSVVRLANHHRHQEAGCQQEHKRGHGWGEEETRTDQSSSSSSNIYS